METSHRENVWHFGLKRQTEERQSGRGHGRGINHGFKAFFFRSVILLSVFKVKVKVKVGAKLTREAQSFPICTRAEDTLSVKVRFCLEPLSFWEPFFFFFFLLATAALRDDILHRLLTPAEIQGRKRA